MRRLMTVFCIWLVTLSAFSQSVSKYQVGTIAAVKPHQTADENASDARSYDDISGQSLDVPIISRKSATDAKQSK